MSLSYFIDNGYGRKVEIKLERVRHGEATHDAISIQEDDFLLTLFFNDEVTASKVFQYIRQAKTFDFSD